MESEGTSSKKLKLTSNDEENRRNKRRIVGNSIEESGTIDSKMLQTDNSKTDGNKMDNMMTESNKAKGNNFEEILYDKVVTGPFVVLLDYNARDSNNAYKKFNKIFCAMWLKNVIKTNGVTSVDAIGYRRGKITFDKYENANLFVTNKGLDTHNLKAYSPRTFVNKFGIAFDVPKSITEDQLKEEAITEIPIISIQRIKRKSLSDSTKLIDTNSVKIGFRGNRIPDHIVIIWGALCPVKFYFPPIKQCYKCLRFGHIQVNCKAQSARCINCSENNCNNQCGGNDMKCGNCGKRDHNAKSEKCQVKIDHKETLKIMTIGNLTYKEAERSIKNKNSIGYIISSCLIFYQRYEVYFENF